MQKYQYSYKIYNFSVMLRIWKYTKKSYNDCTIFRYGPGMRENFIRNLTSFCK